METRKIGSLDVSVVGLGCNNFGRRIGPEQTRAVVHAALDAGVTLFDTSDSYGDSEELLGAALAGRRDEVVVATKFGWDVGGANGPDWGARASRRYVRRAVERSLRRLRTDWIDLYQLHRPDGVTPMEETLAALTDLVREGKVRYIGSSNLTAWQVTEAEWIARVKGHERFISAQNEYSLLNRDAERELLPALGKYGLGLLPYFPLARGLLTGKYRRGAPIPRGTRLTDRPEFVTDERLNVVENLIAFAERQGVTLLDVAFGALLARPEVSSVIAGATSPEQVKANAAAGAWRPAPEALAELDRIAPRPS